ncbi:MAG TPA: hypothetical protein VHU19_14115 [Pyrinomonadaceae bacterium]|jgi:hypothetical protein|nr:hypothetical protein [Pyrinomonadaceae bacterium]
MSLYDKFCSEVSRRRPRPGSGVAGPALIERLSAEQGNPCRYAASFAGFFESRVSALRAGFEERSANQKKLTERRAELLGVVSAHESVLAAATPYTRVEAVADAHSRLAAARYLLDLLEPQLEELDVTDAACAVEKFRSKSESEIEAWRSRLRRERKRIRADIETLERGGEPVNFDLLLTGDARRLLDELMAVTIALADAESCLSVLRPAPPALTTEAWAARHPPEKPWLRDESRKDI